MTPKVQLDALDAIEQADAADKLQAISRYWSAVKMIADGKQPSDKKMDELRDDLRLLGVTTSELRADVTALTDLARRSCRRAAPSRMARRSSKSWRRPSTATTCKVGSAWSPKIRFESVSPVPARLTSATRSR